MLNTDKKTSELNEMAKLVEMIPQQSALKGKTAQQMMRRHIQDKNDLISEEDFKNLRLDMDLPGDHAHQPLEISNDPERPKDEDKDPKALTPWDLIN